ncbi:hypothetical protein PG994_008615 [Apiospora phragmitis]|uniref:Nephrocystin 3-like N-terminal domain-containing protein n=1 Tax=Apiospora phragmitis TaxID=2905665 RepID=A0ABR1UH00_9PEZI
MATSGSSSLVPIVGYDEVVEFMGKLDGESHETLAFRGQEQGTELDYEGIYAEYREVQKKFFQTANKCLEKLKLPPMEASKANGWNGIQASMDTACAALEKVSSRDKDLQGLTGKAKKAFRSLCNKAGAVKVFTQLIPDDMFGSVVGGGLNIILTCMEQTGMHRANVYKALEKLPRIIEDSLAWTMLATQDPHVHKRMAKLYTEVCLTLDHILHWFVLNSLVAGAKRFLSPSAMNTDLQDRVAEVTLAARDLKSKAVQVMWGRQEKGMRDTQELAYMQTAKTHHKLDELAAEVKDIKRLAPRYVSYDAIQTMVQGSLELLLQDDMKPSQSITVKDILEEFQYEQVLIPHDIEALLRLSLPSNNVVPIETNRAHAVQRNPRIRIWLSDDAPYLYLLNGGSQVTADASTSFVMAKIASTLLQQQKQQKLKKDSSAMKLIVLAYFCGQHPSFYRDTAASPSELAMSLLLQLIDQYPGFPSVTLQDCLDRTEPEEISSICGSLRHLLEELSSDAVLYLVVDGIAHFTTPRERMKGMRELVKLLVEAFHGENIPATLKFIFSSPTRSAFLEDLFEEDEILNIPRDPPPANGPL